MSALARLSTRAMMSRGGARSWRSRGGAGSWRSSSSAAAFTGRLAEVRITKPTTGGDWMVVSVGFRKDSPSSTGGGGGMSWMPPMPMDQVDKLLAGTGGRVVAEDDHKYVVKWSMPDGLTTTYHAETETVRDTTFGSVGASVTSATTPTARADGLSTADETAVADGSVAGAIKSSGTVDGGDISSPVRSTEIVTTDTRDLVADATKSQVIVLGDRESRVVWGPDVGDAMSDYKPPTTTKMLSDDTAPATQDKSTDKSAASNIGLYSSLYLGVVFVIGCWVGTHAS